MYVWPSGGVRGAGGRPSLQLLHGGAVLLWRLALAPLRVGGPQQEVVLEELHDGRALLVHVGGDALDALRRIVESGLRERAALVRRGEPLVVEDGEVEREAEADRVRRLQPPHREVVGRLVGLVRLVGEAVVGAAEGELGQVAVVVALHLQVEDLRLGLLRIRHEGVRQDADDVVARGVQLVLHLEAVVLDEVQGRRVARRRLSLLGGVHGAPRRSERAHRVLVRDGQEVPLVDA
mmetsp:Transcript_26633/g.75183  ORF Transcript_26633/g.75183 Transcript_26633/m.75183 type:complete len:235 (+) Transcript_26633:111-815(+)